MRIEIYLLSQGKSNHYRWPVCHFVVAFFASANGRWLPQSEIYGFPTELHPPTLLFPKRQASKLGFNGRLKSRSWPERSCQHSPVCVHGIRAKPREHRFDTLS